MFCPFCRDERDFKTLYALSVHVRAAHSTECPICHRHYKSLTKHAYNQARFRGCVKHKVLYVLLTRASVRNSRVLREWRDEVERLLSERKLY